MIQVIHDGPSINFLTVKTIGKDHQIKVVVSQFQECLPYGRGGNKLVISFFNRGLYNRAEILICHYKGKLSILIIFDGVIVILLFIGGRGGFLYLFLRFLILNVTLLWPRIHIILIKCLLPGILRFNSESGFTFRTVYPDGLILW